ncbi:MAG: transcription elongation factor GreA [Patescibacteria group bacterium]
MTNLSQLQLTQEGFEALKKELEELIDVKRPKLVDRLSYARSQGDLSENSDYTNAKEELEFLDGRIDELTYVCENAIIAKNGGNSKNSIIDMGDKVTVKVNGGKLEYKIVGEWEANPMEKKISATSPLGQALVGKKVGEKVAVEAPAGTVSYEIVAIS